MAYIYCIKNSINDKVYIGKTTHTVNQRFQQHISNAHNYNDRYNSKLYRAIIKYGKEYFYPIVLEECDDKIVDEREQYYIQLYDSVKNSGKVSTYSGAHGDTVNSSGTAISGSKTIYYYTKSKS